MTESINDAEALRLDEAGRFSALQNAILDYFFKYFPFLGRDTVRTSLTICSLDFDPVIFKDLR